MPVEQVEQLRLQRRAGASGVEIGEERIVRFLEHAVASRREASRSASDDLPTPIGPSIAMY